MGLLLLTAGAIACVLVLALLHPGVERRMRMLSHKVRGDLPDVSWMEVGVRLAPGAWQYRIRSLGAASPPAWIEKLDFPLEEGLPVQSYPVFRGPTALLRDLDCHFSILQAGNRPHPPHRHKEEEIIIPISGAVHIIRVDQDGIERTDKISRGQFVYHKPDQPHTIEAPDSGPASYLIFKWIGDKVPNLTESLDSSLFDFGAAFGSQAGESEGFTTQVLFESPTPYLTKLHGHVSTVSPGAGYEPHSDLYDVAVLMLEGRVETLGKQVGANSVIFYPAGELHGMRNPGDGSAKYLVFEFRK